MSRIRQFSSIKKQSKNAPMRRSQKSQSLLVLHLDSEKLRSDALHLGALASTMGHISSLMSGSNCFAEDATTREDLLARLANHAEAGRSFDVVVVIGHSNAQGIRIASDAFVTWEVFAQYLKPFSPRRLLLVACRAGRSDSGEILFKKLPKLRRIYACPVTASKNFGFLMLLSIPYIMAKRRPKDNHVLLAQIAAMGLTGRELREWRRTTDKGNPDAAVFDLLSDVVAPLLSKIPTLL